MEFTTENVKDVLSEDQFDRVSTVNSTYNYIDVSGKVDARFLGKIQDAFGQISCIDNPDNASTIRENHTRVWFDNDYGMSNFFKGSDSDTSDALEQEIVDLINNDEIVAIEDVELLLGTLDSCGYTVTTEYSVE